MSAHKRALAYVSWAHTKETLKSVELGTYRLFQTHVPFKNNLAITVSYLENYAKEGSDLRFTRARISLQGPESVSNVEKTS